MDRNADDAHSVLFCDWSLSARRAWIEMSISALWMAPSRLSLSARRAWIEMFSVREVFANFEGSLSARRAWIEIDVTAKTGLFTSVALRKESVDRNSENPMISIDKIPSLSARRAWIEMFLSMGLDGRFKRRSPQGERG